MQSSEAIFYPGQQVILRSGSPIMTVNAFYDNDSYVDCFWFDTVIGIERYEARLPSRVLTLYVESEIASNTLQLPAPQVGDVVQLRSGGPSMTVEFVRLSDFDNNVSCIWFDEQCRTMTPCSGGFHPNALVLES
ncbi:YodC family protein [Aeromonas veronii]|uniref:YodC family protein n=1 Tax=Aeromonas veronii TaxID=654 RepID=UPI001F17B7C2|nr:DUF2158 domain-containing protein [Aeromonas veronii]MCF5838643.1 DUF2158 domain-containing protein [Aeromonas veronii]